MDCLRRSWGHNNNKGKRKEKGRRRGCLLLIQKKLKNKLNPNATKTNNHINPNDKRNDPAIFLEEKPHAIKKDKWNETNTKIPLFDKIKNTNREKQVRSFPRGLLRTQNHEIRNSYLEILSQRIRNDNSIRRREKSPWHRVITQMKPWVRIINQSLLFIIWQL